jgi:pyruvate dehydrogenase E1 component alpha subunit
LSPVRKTGNAPPGAVGPNANRSDCAVQEDDKPFTVRLSDESFETYEIDPPPYTLETTKKELKTMYHDMVSIR